MPDFAIETPGGVVEAADRGVYRVDVADGETRLSVYEGEAALEAEREVRVRGPASAPTRGAASEPSEPRPSTARSRRLRALERRAARTDRRTRRTASATCPRIVRPYAGELEANGLLVLRGRDRPRLASARGLGLAAVHRRPLGLDAYGWTWVPNEPWGWAPFHYGRWDHSPALGWYWIPGSTWGPAWVSWAVGGDYVGWCPLGYRDRPVVLYGAARVNGRGATRPATGAGSDTWAAALRRPGRRRDLARTADVGSRRRAERRLAEHREAPAAMRVAELAAGADPRAEAAATAPAASALRTVQDAAEPRRHGARSCAPIPATTIPLPTAAARREDARHARRRRAARGGQPPDRLRSPREPAPRQRRRDAAPELRRPGTAPERSARPTDRARRAASPRRASAIRADGPARAPPQPRLFGPPRGRRHAHAC